MTDPSTNGESSNDRSSESEVNGGKEAKVEGRDGAPVEEPGPLPDESEVSQQDDTSTHGVQIRKDADTC